MEPNEQNQMNQMPQAQPLHHSKKWIIFSLVAVILIAAGVWYWYNKQKVAAPTPVTPEQTLQQLKDTSAPVTQTDDQRKAELDMLSKSSAAPSGSVDDRLERLKAMGNN